jgi:hypothetical protein
MTEGPAVSLERRIFFTPAGARFRHPARGKEDENALRPEAAARHPGLATHSNPPGHALENAWPLGPPAL